MKAAAVTLAVKAARRPFPWPAEPLGLLSQHHGFSGYEDGPAAGLAAEEIPGDLDQQRQLGALSTLRDLQAVHGRHLVLTRFWQVVEQNRLVPFLELSTRRAADLPEPGGGVSHPVPRLARYIGTL